LPSDVLMITGWHPLKHVLRCFYCNIVCRENSSTSSHCTRLAAFPH